MIKKHNLSHDPIISQDDAPIETRTLSDQVYQFLTNKIIEGEISYGARLNIREIAESLRISTMPVREALRRLSIENVVSIKPRSNCILNIPTRRSMLSAFQIREMIEIYAMSLIYPMYRKLNLHHLSRFLNKMESTSPVSNDDQRMVSYAKYDQLFHQEFVVLTDNKYLLQMYRTNMLHLNIALTFQAGIEPDIGRVNYHHAMIYEKLKAGSSEAVEVLKDHLSQCRNNMIKGDLFNSFK